MRASNEEPFTIMDAMGYLNLSGSVRGSGLNRTINCPKCGRRNAFSFNVDKNCGQCFHSSCNYKANQISLVADFEGISNSDAVQKVLRYLGTGIGSMAHQKATEERQHFHEATPAAPLDVRDAFFKFLIQQCPLSKRHINDLMARGLDMDEIATLGYGSWDNSDFAAQRLERLLTMNGFKPGGLASIYESESDHSLKLKWNPNGIIVPQRTWTRQLCSAQIRKNNEDLKKDQKQKYGWMTSNGEYKGAKAVIIAHFACDWVFNLKKGCYEPDMNGQPWAITEGAMKADIAHLKSGGGKVNHYRGGMNFLSIPGTKNQQGLPSALQYLKSRGVTEIYDCLDMDYLTNENVALDMQKLRDTVLSEGLEYKRFNWQTDPEGPNGPILKGIDDFFVYRSKLLAH